MSSNEDGESDCESVASSQKSRLMVINSSFPVGKPKGRVHFEVYGQGLPCHSPKSAKLKGRIFKKLSQSNLQNRHEARSTSAKKRDVITSDITFENRQLRFYSLQNNGIRPHGGNCGLKGLPPDVNCIDHSQLADGEKQKAEQKQEQFVGSRTPSYVHGVKDHKLHSGQYPLFAYELLPSNKREQRYNGDELFFHKRLDADTQRLRSAPPRVSSSMPPQAGKIRFYKPNTTHQYLTDVELRDYAERNVNLDLGKPTRAQLLRQRHRLGESLTNRSDEKKQLKARLERMRENVMPNSSRGVPDMAVCEVPEGETPHSFLLGARYNRAHCLDMNVFHRYGVYLPRNTDCSAFVVNAKTDNLPRDDVSQSQDSVIEEEEELSESVRIAVNKSQQRVLEAAERERCRSAEQTPTESYSSPRRAKSAFMIQGRGLGRASTGNPITDTLQANLLAQYGRQLEQCGDKGENKESKSSSVKGSATLLAPAPFMSAPLEQEKKRQPEVAGQDLKGTLQAEASTAAQATDEITSSENHAEGGGQEFVKSAEQDAAKGKPQTSASARPTSSDAEITVVVLQLEKPEVEDSVTDATPRDIV